MAYSTKKKKKKKKEKEKEEEKKSKNTIEALKDDLKSSLKIISSEN